MSRRQHESHRLIGSVLLAIAAIAHPLPAQPRRLPAPVIGQIVDEVLSHVIPPDSSLSRMPIRERGIYFDYGRTLAAFGYRDDSMTRAALALKSVVMPGTDSLLGDCSQASAKPCDRLGPACVRLRHSAVAIERCEGRAAPRRVARPGWREIRARAGAI